jgi:hypothetical protein
VGGPRADRGSLLIQESSPELWPIRMGGSPPSLQPEIISTMKRSLALSILLVFFAFATGQAQGHKPLETYGFDVSVPIVECSFQGNVLSTSQDFAPQGAQFVYLSEVSLQNPPRQGAVIQFLNWHEDTPEYKLFNVQGTPGPVRSKYFCVDKSTLETMASRTYASGWGSWDLAAGILLLPIKMRLASGTGSFDFSKDVTVGTVAGPRWRLSPRREVFFSGLVGAGLTAVSLDSANTGGAIKQSTDRAAVTLTLGGMLEVNRFQLGLMIGQDRISNPNQSDWRYHGKPWLSLGLGYALLSAPSATPSTKQ